MSAADLVVWIPQTAIVHLGPELHAELVDGQVVALLAGQRRMPPTEAERHMIVELVRLRAIVTFYERRDQIAVEPQPNSPWAEPEN